MLLHAGLTNSVMICENPGGTDLSNVMVEIKANSRLKGSDVALPFLFSQMPLRFPGRSQLGLHTSGEVEADFRASRRGARPMVAVPL